jgi:hypothetical protein
MEDEEYEQSDSNRHYLNWWDNFEQKEKLEESLGKIKATRTSPRNKPAGFDDAPKDPEEIRKRIEKCIEEMSSSEVAIKEAARQERLRKEEQQKRQEELEDRELSRNHEAIVKNKAWIEKARDQLLKIAKEYNDELIIMNRQGVSYCGVERFNNGKFESDKSYMLRSIYLADECAKKLAEFTKSNKAAWYGGNKVMNLRGKGKKAHLQSFWYTLKQVTDRYDKGQGKLLDLRNKIEESKAIIEDMKKGLGKEHFLQHAYDDRLSTHRTYEKDFAYYRNMMYEVRKELMEKLVLLDDLLGEQVQVYYKAYEPPGAYNKVYDGILKRKRYFEASRKSSKRRR